MVCCSTEMWVFCNFTEFCNFPALFVDEMYSIYAVNILFCISSVKFILFHFTSLVQVLTLFGPVWWNQNFTAKFLFYLSSTRYIDYWWQDSDSIVTVVNCQQHSDYSTAIHCPSVQSLYSGCLVSDRWNRSFAVYISAGHLIIAINNFTVWQIDSWYLYIH